MTTLSQIAATMDRGARDVLDRSSDRDEVIAACTETLRPHALILDARRSPLATDLRHRAVGSMSFNRLRYGASVTVAPAGPQEGTFLVTLPISGSGRLRYGRDDAIAARGFLYVIGPYQRFQLDFESDYDQLVVRLDRRRVERVAAAITGAPDAAPVAIPLSMGRTPPTFLALLEAILGHRDGADRPASERFTRHLEEILIESLLLPYVEVSGGRAGAESRSARIVARATEYVLAHWGQPVSLTAIAMACRTSVRSVQSAFRNELGTTPTAWLRVERLERARRELARTRPEESTVTEVAARNGFLHLGEFSRHYRDRFGESPSSTLRRQP